jgi:hypothetical protein
MYTVLKLLEEEERLTYCMMKVNKVAFFVSSLKISKILYAYCIGSTVYSIVSQLLALIRLRLTYCMMKVNKVAFLYHHH